MTKKRIHRLFFPEDCFRRNNSLWNQETAPNITFIWYGLHICACAFALSVKLFVDASLWMCILCSVFMVVSLTYSRQQMEYLKTLPFSAREYALGRLFWSLVWGIGSVLFYILTSVLRKDAIAVKYGLPHPLPNGQILLFALVHFSLVVLSGMLTTLIRTRLSAKEFLWLLIPLVAAASAVCVVDSALEVFVHLWMTYVTGPVCIAIFILSVALTAVCFLGTVRSFERWESVDRKLSPIKPLVVLAAVLAVAAGGYFLTRQSPYTSPVDEALTPDRQYQVAVQCQENGDLYGAAVSFYACGDYLDAGARCRELWRELAPYVTVAATYRQVIALTQDGSVLVTTGRGVDFTVEDVPDPQRLVSIHGGDHFVAGLYDDGTVAVFGDVADVCRDEIAGWTDIVALSVSPFIVAGLRADGTTVACSFNYVRHGGENDLAGMENLVSVSVGPLYIIGIHPDGTVSTEGRDGNGRGSVWFWRDVVDVGGGDTHTVGLHADGTVSVTGYGGRGQCDTEDWTDVTAIETGYHCTVGLRSDGTVLAAGMLDEKGDLDDVGTWTDIVDIRVSGSFVLGLKADGTLEATAGHIQELIASWENIRLPG